MSKQLEYFKEYKARLASTIGQEGADNLTTNAVFFVNCAVNDFLITFYGPGRRLLAAGTTIGQYEDFVLQLLQEFIQGLVGLGARRIAVSGVPLFGCWPYIITFYSSNLTDVLVTRACNDTLNAVGNDYNMKVQAALSTQQNSSANIGLKLAYFDTYTPMLNIQRNPAVFGRKETKRQGKKTNVNDMQNMINSHTTKKQMATKDLLEQGARRIGVVGLPPMGCLPIVITVNSDNAILNRGCVDFFSLVARQYNLMLQTKLNTMQFNVSADSGVRIVYTDVYEPLSDMIIQGLKYDFDEVSSGCCRTGLLETAFLCNTDSYVCSNALKYVFWDSIHLSEKTYKLYKLLFEAAKSDIDFLIAD
ncbi:hypothetical protein RHGRI_037654 [Rhododendron griersonianum]|uniref:GDSL esterase/lipase n=1 Tax=Rhododendron griersonianum TaxID=479676 RepID=A0AAV6HY78_9ERIC|nr:hypothetical protein RHGRI_037654 [Rhododendron griersonianum]